MSKKILALVLLRVFYYLYHETATLMPVLSSMSSRILSSDDEYSFTSMTKVLSLVLPPLMRHKELGVDAFIRLFTQ